jgi:hypothetical protein
MTQESIAQLLSANQGRSNHLASWLDRRLKGGVELGDHDFRHSTDQLGWDDVQLLCAATGREEMFWLMRRGADPFGLFIPDCWVEVPASVP